MRTLAKDHGSFAAWLATQHPRGKDDWVKLMRQNFLFMGGEVVGEFLMSIGYLPGAHVAGCPVYKRILELDPPWRRPVPPRDRHRGSGAGHVAG
jgi:DNA-3-methyladenine glycosylase I